MDIRLGQQHSPHPSWGITAFTQAVFYSCILYREAYHHKFTWYWLHALRDSQAAAQVLCWMRATAGVQYTWHPLTNISTAFLIAFTARLHIRSGLSRQKAWEEEIRRCKAWNHGLGLSASRAWHILPSILLPLCSSWVNNLTDRSPWGKSTWMEVWHIWVRGKKPVYKVMWLNSKKCVFDTFS